MVSILTETRESGLVPELDKGMDHVQDRSVQTSRLAWPGQLSALVKPGFVSAKNSRAKIVQQPERERGPRMVTTL